MAEVFAAEFAGLREQKKGRTRSAMIGAAMELCLKRGYENTTVEQIAAAADVSPRTFSRYFATKDAVFMTIIADYAEVVAKELEVIPLDVGPMEALRSAHVTVLTRIASRPHAGPLTNARIVLMLQVINASTALRQAAVDFRHTPTQELVAKRMGLPVDDRKAALLLTVFSAAMLAAWGDLIDEDVDGSPLGPTTMIDRIDEAFAQVAEFAADLRPAGLATG